MANIGNSKKVKSYPDPKDQSPMVKIRLGYEQHMDRTKPHVLPVSVNGYTYNIPFGKTVEVPENIVKVIENARIRYVKNSPLDRYQHSMGGQGRPQSEVLNSESEMADIPMYDLVRL